MSLLYHSREESNSDNVSLENLILQVCSIIPCIICKGLKIYGFADQLGFLWSFWVYRGKHGGQRAKPSEIVKDFVIQLPNAGKTMS